MKKIILSVALVSSVMVSAQTKNGCSELQSRVENQKLEIVELTKQNQYYKETLDLLKPLASATAENLKFDVVKIVGSKKDKTLYVYYTYTNTTDSPRKYFQPNQAYFVDPQGNQVSSYEVFASADRERVENIQPNVPMKGVLKFKIEVFDFPLIKLLNLKVGNVETSKNGLFSNLVFKNLPVNWQ